MSQFLDFYIFLGNQYIIYQQNVCDMEDQRLRYVPLFCIHVIVPFYVSAEYERSSRVRQRDILPT